VKLYAVRNREGLWFHRKGYGGYGPSWREGVENATLYHRIGQARSRVTYFARAFPDYGVPDLVEFEVTETGVVQDENARAKKAVKRLDRHAEIRRGQQEWRRLEEWRRIEAEYRRTGRLPGEAR
jgi:hypothetical protein